MWWIGFHSFLNKARVYVNAFEYFNTICMYGAWTLALMTTRGLTIRGLTIRGLTIRGLILCSVYIDKRVVCTSILFLILSFILFLFWWLVLCICLV
jgi:hypothetical protein